MTQAVFLRCKKTDRVDSQFREERKTYRLTGICQRQNAPYFASLVPLPFRMAKFTQVVLGSFRAGFAQTGMRSLRSWKQCAFRKCR